MKSFQTFMEQIVPTKQKYLRDLKAGATELAIKQAGEEKILKDKLAGQEKLMKMESLK